MSCCGVFLHHLLCFCHGKVFTFGSISLITEDIFFKHEKVNYQKGNSCNMEYPAFAPLLTMILDSSILLGLVNTYLCGKGLTLSETTYFRLFQMQKDENFKSEEKW